MIHLATASQSPDTLNSMPYDIRRPIPNALHFSDTCHPMPDTL